MRAPAPNETTGSVVSRRFVLKAGALVGGGCLLGFQVRAANAAASDETGPSGVFAPNAFIRIASDGQVTLIMPQAEMGQGIYTAHAMILAEELDADFGRVTVEASPPSDALYGNPIFGLQATGGSTSVRAFWTPLRKAGAAARAMLVSAAAVTWSVDPATCRTQGHQVIHDATGRKLDYGALAAPAVLVAPPSDPPLKAIKDFRLIGKPLKRLDTPGKVDGKVVYGIDTLPEGVKFATIAACPVFGGKVAHVDDSETKSIPGLRQVLVFDDFVATVGDHTWAALQALAALDIVWDGGQNTNVNSAELWDRIRTASQQPGAVAKSVGDVDAALREGETVEAVYQLPFLAHADMEPMNCTVHVRADGCDVWAGSQVQARAQAVAAEITGLPLDRVKFQNPLLGGGFGRRLEVDYIARAVRVGQRVDDPVKVIWSREEDIQHDIYRPIYFDRLTASVKDGKIVGWNHRIAGSSVVARWLPPAYTNNVDFDAVDSAVDMPYDIPNRRVQYVRHEPLSIPTGFWRGVGPNNNVFAIESFVDELAAKLRKDPVAFRRELLGQNPRLRAALDLAASKAGWGESLPPRVGRGVSAQVSFASFIVSIAEAEVDTNGEVLLRRMVCAVDTGIAVNPDTVVAQLQGGLIFGLTAALFGEITIAGGRVQQKNFNDYRMLRINEIPSIEVHIIDSDQPPGGIGETGCTAAPAALTNAIFAATGIRLRKLPIDRDILAGKKPA
jgi:isoquinoline 1-oxidoreductase beta subunit